MRNLFCDAFNRRIALGLVLAVPAAAVAAPIATRRKQEPMRQLFVVKSADGKVIGNCEEVSTAEGDHMRSALTFRFLDGSLDEQITTYTQENVFRLIHDHHVQKGPSFPTQLDMTIDVPNGTVTWHAKERGRDEVTTRHMSLPDDVANGLVPLLTENVPPGSARLDVSWVAIAIKPLIVTLTIQPDRSPEMVPKLQHASRYLLHVELHGLAKLVAPLLNRQPEDLHVWVTDDAQPSFLRMRGPFYQGGPVWTVESLGHGLALAAH
jgi:hypothetical protein